MRLSRAAVRAFPLFLRSLPLTCARAGRSLALPRGRVRVLEPAPDAEPAQHAAGLRRARELHDARVGELRAQPRPEPHRPYVSSACARGELGLTRGAVKNATYWPSYRKAPKEIVLRRHGNFVEDDDYRKDGIALYVTIDQRASGQKANFRPHAQHQHTGSRTAALTCGAPNGPCNVSLGNKRTARLLRRQTEYRDGRSCPLSAATEAKERVFSIDHTMTYVYCADDACCLVPQRDSVLTELTGDLAMRLRIRACSPRLRTADRGTVNIVLRSLKRLPAHHWCAALPQRSAETELDRLCWMIPRHC
jgi:hypothetical protein